MKKKTIALFMTAAMTAALCSCGSQPETTVAEENQAEDSESPDDEDAADEISATEEESADDTEEENTDGEKEDLADDRIAPDSDDAEESDESEESGESDEDSSAAFDLGFMSFELPADWDLDDYESSPEDGEYYFAPGGDVYASNLIISVAHTNSEEEAELASMMLENDGAILEEYINSELGDQDFFENISVKELGHTFIGKTIEITMEMAETEYSDSGLMTIYIGLNNDDIYGFYLAIDDITEADIDIRDGMAAIDMLFETGKLLK